MKTAKSIIVVLFVLLTAQIASAYYCPSTGRWLSRDPIGEPGFENLRAASVTPKVGKVVSSVSLRSSRWINRDSVETQKEPNRYVFVKNNPELNVDLLGLNSEPDVSWAPAPCPNGQSTIYIQVLYGGIGPYSGPRVDDGNAGYGTSGGSKGCPDYKGIAANAPGVFQDTPSGLTGPVEFNVCRVCTKPCCAGIKNINGINGPNGSYPISGYSIVSVGPCVHWKKGDTGDLSHANTFQTFPGATQAWQDAMQREYPKAASGGCTPSCGN
jgi:hypothetical protein